MLLLFVKFLFAIILTEAVTGIVSKSGVFLPFREFLNERVEKSFLFNYLNDLVTCPYCFSVWAAWFSVIVFGLTIKGGFLDPYFGYFLVGLVVHRLSNVLHYIIDRIDPSLGSDVDDLLEALETPKIKGFDTEEKV